ncbi:MAG: hypothetical protein J6T88_09310 [Bacteroidales bacterium]|nr:hypothetical protein [Bacteroidales bacterium]
MKKTFRIFAALIAVSILASCNSDKKNIEKVAYGYLNATGNYLADEAMPYATPETQETLRFLKEVLIPLTDTSYIAANTPAEITINNIEVAKDTALVYYTKVTPLKTLEAQITVIKFDGKWLVDLPLENKADTTSNLTLSIPAAPNLAQ